MKTSLIATILATTLAFSLSAYAENGRRAGDKEKPRESRKQQEEKILKEFDKDGDGRLSGEERAAARAASKENRGKEKEGAGAEAEDGSSREAMIKKFDKDGDGKLNEEERAAAKAANKETREKEKGKSPEANEGKNKTAE